MKNKFLILAILAVAALYLPSQAKAQMYGETLHISLMGGYLWPNNQIALDSGGIYGLGLGYNFTKNWGIEAFGYFSPNLNDDGLLPRWKLNTNPPGYNNDVTMARISALYHFDTGTNFTPYVSLGVGGQWIARDRPGYNNYSSFAVNGAIGFKIFFNEVVALRLEVNDAYGFTRTQRANFNAPTVTAGLTFQVGANPVCRDEDGDGVCDPYDKCPGTPAGYKVDADGCPITVTIRMDIKFDFDKAVVKKAYLPEVKKVADFLNAHPGSTAVVEGHTDNVGTDEYNQKLSDRRAAAVRKVLVSSFGVNESKVTSVGYGESRPIATNDTAAGRAENRRVVGVFSGTDVQ
ncbi:MAG: OmpA family protein [Deltaproteobacteria bacterium]|jgi:OOP family OmpA-OmpF porin|nr:OmpA family protein [Deltaproteobacteria bacterium]